MPAASTWRNGPLAGRRCGRGAGRHRNRSVGNASVRPLRVLRLRVVDDADQASRHTLGPRYAVCHHRPVSRATSTRTYVAESAIGVAAFAVEPIDAGDVVETAP